MLSGFNFIGISVFDILHGLAEDIGESFDYSQDHVSQKKSDLKEWVRQDHLNLAELINYTDVQSRI